VTGAIDHEAEVALASKTNHN